MRQRAGRREEQRRVRPLQNNHVSHVDLADISCDNRTRPAIESMHAHRGQGGGGACKSVPWHAVRTKGSARRHMRHATLEETAEEDDMHRALPESESTLNICAWEEMARARRSVEIKDLHMMSGLWRW